MDKNKGGNLDTRFPKNSSFSNIGNLIKEARLNKKLSTNELAEDLKISEQQLKAIEEGKEDQLPEKVFIKAMVRKISEKLQLDTDFIMGEFSNKVDEHIIDKGIEDVSTEGENNKNSTKEIPYLFFITVLISGLIGILGSSVVLNIFSNIDNNDSKQEIIKKY